jgi:hypothetical protein
VILLVDAVKRSLLLDQRLCGKEKEKEIGDRGRITHVKAYISSNLFRLRGRFSCRTVWIYGSRWGDGVEKLI